MSADATRWQRCTRAMARLCKHPVSGETGVLHDGVAQSIMQRIVPVALVSLLLLGCSHAPGQRPPLAAAAEAIVPEIARQFSACDLDALMANYSASVEYVSPSTPTPIVGNADLRTHFTGACAGSVRAIMKVEVQRVRMLSSDSAVVTGTYSFGRSDQPGAKPWPAFFVITLARDGGRWLVGTQATFAIPGR